MVGREITREKVFMVMSDGGLVVACRSRGWVVEISIQGQSVAESLERGMYRREELSYSRSRGPVLYPGASLCPRGGNYSFVVQRPLIAYKACEGWIGIA